MGKRPLGESTGRHGTDGWWVVEWKGPGISGFALSLGDPNGICPFWLERDVMCG